jgi:hypothetical protein
MLGSGVRALRDALLVCASRQCYESCASSKIGFKWCTPCNGLTRTCRKLHKVSAGEAAELQRLIEWDSLETGSTVPMKFDYTHDLIFRLISRDIWVFSVLFLFCIKDNTFGILASHSDRKKLSGKSETFPQIDSWVTAFAVVRMRACQITRSNPRFKLDTESSPCLKDIVDIG